MAHTAGRTANESRIEQNAGPQLFMRWATHPSIIKTKSTAWHNKPVKSQPSAKLLPASTGASCAV